MSTPISVLGVLGLCWVDFRYPTQIKPLFFVASRAVCWVCWVLRRGRACVKLIASITERIFFSHARTYKPNEPNTLNTDVYKLLVLKGFKCVGFVLGSLFCVLGSFFGGKGQ